MPSGRCGKRTTCWLILAIVVVFTGFPRAYASVSTFLHVPLVLVLLGIVLRGSAFVFRAYGRTIPRQERFWGRVFAIASTTTPLFLGVIVGAVTEGRAAGRGRRLVRRGLHLAVADAVLGGGGRLRTGAVRLPGGRLPDARGAPRRRAGGLPPSRPGVRRRWSFALAATVLALGSGGRARRPAHGPVGRAAARGTGASALAAFAFLWWRRYELARLAAAAQVRVHPLGLGAGAVPLRHPPAPDAGGASAPDNVQVIAAAGARGGRGRLLPSLLYLFRIFGPRGQRQRRA